MKKHLGRKYHGKNERKLDKDAGLKAWLRHMFASKDIPFFDSDDEEGSDYSSVTDDDDVVYEHGDRRVKRTAGGKFQVEIPIRSMFSRPYVWASLGG